MKRSRFDTEYELFCEIEHWKAAKEVVAPEMMMSPDERLFGLFFYLYTQTKELYGELPRRKNGENPFIHPLNVALNLQKAGVTDAVTLCAGLIHDYVEEVVDIYKAKEGIEEDAKGIRQLDAYEKVVVKSLEEKLRSFAKREKIEVAVVWEIIGITKLLTRHKRDFYYKSIIGIFQCPDERMRKKAIQVKLADRIHNILCIETFTEQQRLFQCFKNLFLLNNVKVYLMEKKGVMKKEENRREKKLLGDNVTEKLFKKCGKATYDAFLYVCYRSLDKKIGAVTSMIQLAFRKFVLERRGLWEVTVVNRREMHPLRLFQGVIRRYDARLHHQWKIHDLMKAEELAYCGRFFLDFKFMPEQIMAIVEYKDAYAFKEAVAYLLYSPEYMIGRFSYQKLFRKVE